MKPSKLAALALGALLLTGCAQAAPEPTLEDAGRQCIEDVLDNQDVTTKEADRLCEIMYEENGHDRFMEIFGGVE